MDPHPNPKPTACRSPTCNLTTAAGITRPKARFKPTLPREVWAASMFYGPKLTQFSVNQMTFNALSVICIHLENNFNNNLTEKL